MIAYIFPGQGAQFTGMGKDLYDSNEQAKKLFEKANKILGFNITNIMFEGTVQQLKETKVTQPAVFLHSVISALTKGSEETPNMVSGHSLGEISALVINKTLTFEAGLILVHKRALAMQEACETNPSTMAAIIGLSDEIVEEVCNNIEGVVAANYNCPGQLVISGKISAVEQACEVLKEKGARRALILPVGGGFHSQEMEPAKVELEKAINNTEFNTPTCPIYQNIVARAVSDPSEIKANLISQLTGAVKWAQCVSAMSEDGATDFVEFGPGKVLQGLVKKINRELTTRGV
ncbi:MAG: ACP S-malonyltransferase [Flavobacteriaceae bacterium]|nr:ACP S-malonyltransferase [Flavobacteriaceae bacterium]